MMNTEIEHEKKSLNPDPITGEPGSHPLGTGLGSAGGAATGAAIGAIAGPIGAAIGGVIGAVAGGLAGHSIAEGIDPTAENEHWQENYRNEPYHDSKYEYSDYEPAYRAGYSSYAGRQNFEEVETDLSKEWEKQKGISRLEWEEARPAAKAGWHRVQTPRDVSKD